MNSYLFSRINTSTVTKLVLVAEILAISILHTVKSNHVNRSTRDAKQEVGIYKVNKKLGPGKNITLANNDNNQLSSY
jgi:hypothetical protein